MPKRVGMLIGLLVLLVGALYAVSQLRTSRVEVPLPSDGKSYENIQYSPSRLGVDLQISLPALARAINGAVPKTYSGVEGDALGNAATEDTLTWDVSVGEILLKPVADGIAFNVPITAGHATAYGRFGVKRRNKGILGWIEEAAGFTASQSADFAGVVNGIIRPRLLPDWTIQPGLTLSVDLSKAEAGLFGDLNIKLSFRDAIKKEIENELNTLAGDINRRLASDGTLRSSVQKTWNDLHLATQIQSGPSVWVTLKPVALGTSQLSVVANDLQFALEITTHTGLQVGSDRPSIIASPLPALKNTSQKQGFEIYIPIAVSLSEFHGISPSTVGLPDPVETKVGKVRMDKIYLVSDSNRLYVGADLVADIGLIKKVKATVYLTGKPEFDSETNHLRFDGLRYDLATKNALLGAADVALESEVLSYLRSLAVFDLSKEREKALSQANTELSKLLSSLPQGINADLQITDVRIGGVRVAPGWIYLLVEGSGHSNIQVSSLDDLLK